MTLMTIVKQAEKLVANHSPQILTAIGVTGTITTAVLTGKATFKAAQIISDAQFKEHVHSSKSHNLEPKEKVKLVWKLYIPAATTCVLTVACVITATQIGTRRAAALAAAYNLSEKAFTEYKEKVSEKIGEAKERAVRDDIAQDQVNRNPVSNRQVVIAGGNVLCYEPATDRYFESDMESLKKAQNDLNYQINNNYYASLSEFYDLIGLAHTSMSDDMGWNSDELLDLSFSTTLASDGRPCLVMNYKVVPIKGYGRVQ